MVAKLLGFLFVTLLLIVHFFDLQENLDDRPLSTLRDYDPKWIGYLLFALLVGIGSEAAITARRAKAWHHMGTYVAMNGLLTLVVFTPSWSGFHDVCAFGLLGLLYTYYFLILYVNDRFFLCWLHVFSPILLFMDAGFSSFGAWQKEVIVYFVVAVIIHEQSLAEWVDSFEPQSKRATRRKKQVGR